MLKSPSRGTPCDINVIYALLKSTFSGLQFCRRHYTGLCLAVVAFQSLEITKITTKFDLTAAQGHPRSSSFVSNESFTSYPISLTLNTLCWKTTHSQSLSYLHEWCEDLH